MSLTNVKKWLILAVALAVLGLCVWFPVPERILSIDGIRLESQGRSALGVLLFCLICWVSELMPFHMTGFIGMLLLAFLKADTFAAMIKVGFGSDTIVFFIGSMIISSCITISGLGKRISMFVLSRTGNRTALVLLAFLFVGMVISAWVTTLAGAAIMTPLGLAILEQEGLSPPKSNFGKALMIACGWGPLCGGIAAPTGSGCNPIAINFIKEICGIEITFGQWMIYGVPCAILLVFVCWIVLLLFFKPEMPSLCRTKEQLTDDYKALSPMGRTEKVLAYVFGLTVLLWIASSFLGRLLNMQIPTSLPAVLGASLLFLPGIGNMEWKQVEKDISWSNVLMIATGLAIGTAFYTSHAAEWLSQLLFGRSAELPPLLRVFFIILAISVLKLGLSSNTVTATVVIPIIIAMATQSGLPLMSVLIPACMAMSLAYVVVTSTPTNVIPHATGWFTISDMAKAGLANTVLCSVVLALSLFGIGSLTGIF